MGKFIEWSDDLSVGFEEIDEQHKILIRLVNKMHEAIHKRKGSDVVEEILGELATYTKTHFVVEESLMRILGYPDYEDHKVAHDDLLEQVIELKEKVATGQTTVSFQLMHFLKNWLTQHIMVEDAKYTNFFHAAGAKSKLEKKSWIKRLWS